MQRRILNGQWRGGAARRGDVGDRSAGPDGADAPGSAPARHHCGDETHNAARTGGGPGDGLNLQSGDRVRTGEVVAHVINREIEAAEHGLEVAEQIDPAEAAALARSVNRYSRGPE